MSATATETPNPIAGLNKMQKLAGLLVVLGPEEASVILSAFNQRQMEQIMGEMAKIEFLSAEVQQGLLEEFSSVTLEAVTSALGGVEKAQNVLEKSLGQAKAREVLGRVAPEATTSPMLEELRNMSRHGHRANAARRTRPDLGARPGAARRREFRGNLPHDGTGVPRRRHAAHGAHGTGFPRRARPPDQGPAGAPPRSEHAATMSAPTARNF